MIMMKLFLQITLHCCHAITKRTQLLASSLHDVYPEGHVWLWERKQDQAILIHPVPNCSDPYRTARWKQLLLPEQFQQLQLQRVKVRCYFLHAVVYVPLVKLSVSCSLGFRNPVPPSIPFTSYLYTPLRSLTFIPSFTLYPLLSFLLELSIPLSRLPSARPASTSSPCPLPSSVSNLLHDAESSSYH